MVKRVLQNLLSNAIKYSKHGAILLGVRRKKYQVELFVADQGVGISSADQRNIFDEFTRLEITSSWSHGHGLGLAIAQGFAKLLNSNIQLDSEVGRGSCFRFQLPRCAPSDAVIAKPASHEIRQLDLTHIQFICIDNDPKILTAMSQLLNQWQVGHVTVSTDGNIDENIISRQSPAIILADYHLDHGSLGTDVVAQLEPLFDVLATIVISADLDTELRQAVQQKGYYFLSKPVKPLALKSLLKTILSQAEITEH